MKALRKRTIGELVKEDFRTAEVFREFGLDFCCGGGKTVEEACEGQGVDPRRVEKELKEVNQREVAASQHFDLWSLDFLIDYIVENHHGYTRTKLPEIKQYADKVAKVHGERHSELHQINDLIDGLVDEIFDHLRKEEKILFPYIKRLVEAKDGGDRPRSDQFSDAADPIEMMEDEHQEAGDTMKKIRKLSDDFTPPANACTSYRLLYQNLEEFEKDLHQHIHLENNILFPKALQIEEAMNEAVQSDD